MLCPKCGRETEGVNHNGRGWRCTWCWTALARPEPEAAARAEGPALAVTAAEPSGKPKAKKP